MLLRQVPAARPHQQHRGLVVERVMPAGLGIVEGDRAAHRVAQVDLALDQIVPGRRVGILEIGHEDVGAGIERVDHHLAVDRAGDLDAAVEQIRGQRRHRPVAVADRLGLGQEIGLLAGIELRLHARRARPRSRCRSAPNLRCKLDDEGQRLRRQHALVAGLDARRLSSTPGMEIAMLTSSDRAARLRTRIAVDHHGSLRAAASHSRSAPGSAQIASA